MRYVIRMLALAGLLVHNDEPPPEGAYLAAYDADAHDGRGLADWTDDLSRALKFDTPAEAMSYWRQQSRVRPLREDGEPNRPLTAYTVEIVPVESAR